MYVNIRVIMKLKFKKIIVEITRFFIYYFIFFLLVSSLWINQKFGKPSFEQFIYHIQFGQSNLLEIDLALVRSFIKNCLIYPAFAALFFYFYEKFISYLNYFGPKKTFQKINNITRHLSRSALLIFYKNSTFAFKIKLPLILLAVSIILFLNTVNFFQYVQFLANDTDFIEKNYVYPAEISSPKNKRNLVLIYVESLENTYSNTKIFQEDILLSLNNKTSKAISFNNFRQSFGANWTMGGIVSSQCGIPLKASLFDGNLIGEKIYSFLPNAICLGDILKNHGYKNVFLGGASLDFAGKGKFLSQHGYSEVYGAQEWKNRGEKNFNGWGLYDDDLFKHAKKKLSELEKDKISYNLTILTLDTHHPSGFLSKTCSEKGANDYIGILKCTSDLLSDFITFMSKNGYLENTNLIIMGDHLAMINPVYENLKMEGNRTIFNKFIVPKSLIKNRDDIYHHSIFATVLYSLGFRFEKNRLALGTSGFGDLDSNSYIDNLDPKDMSKNLSSYSPFYWDFWNLRK